MNAERLHRYRLLLVLAFGLAGALSLPAAAAESVRATLPVIKVKYGDLDLDTEKGRRELLDRLSRASRKVCREYASSYAVGYQEVYRGCYRASLSAAVDDVHQRQVTELYASVARTPAY